MKTHALLAAVMMIGCTSARPEPRSYPDYSGSSGFTATDNVSVENLEVLAKVWGFAKYHHPVFADTVLNADYELFGLLPQVATADKEERNAVLAAWVEDLGEFRSAEDTLRKQIAGGGYTSPANWDWLSDEATLGTELSQTLQHLRWAHRSKPSRYAYITQQGFISFDAESVHAPAGGNDHGYNLLTLFRLWNMAEYYFPSVNITDKNWSGVLSEYIPKFLGIGNAQSPRLTVSELISELSDTHSGMLDNPLFMGRRLPVELSFVEGKLIVTGNIPAQDKKHVLEPGDEIISIDGRMPDYYIDRSRRFIAASNESIVLRNAANLVTYVLGEQVSLTVERKGRRMEIAIATLPLKEYFERLQQKENNKTYYELIAGGKVGYLYPGKFKNADGPAIMERFADTRGIVIDMRCYPAELMPFSFVGRYFVPHKTKYVIFTRSVDKLPGWFAGSPFSLGSTNDDYYKGKVVVLVNAETLSRAEYTTMAFQAAPGCVVVGSQTAGADGDVVMLLLPGGIRTLISGLGVFYPDGTNTQRVGVRIDHYVTPTVEGIRAGRDELLEKALEIINQP